MSDAVTVVLDATARLLRTTPMLLALCWMTCLCHGGGDEVADTVEELDDRVPPSRLDVTWSWLMEE